MIIKDEKEVICRALASTKPLIDYWVIVDTGSTDGTQAIVKEFMKDIPGELVERPWVNFAHNRNEALDYAKGKGDYLLILDADDSLVYPQEYSLPPLDKDFYYLTIDYNGVKYARPQLINNHLNWRWAGVIHEALQCPQARSKATLETIIYKINGGGARSKDPKKYEKDALVLENALQDDPTNTRYMFYLAQSYRDAGLQEKSIEAYNKRIAMGGWDEEIYYSLLEIALQQATLELPLHIVADSFTRAIVYRPSRAEPYYYLSKYLRENDLNFSAYFVINQALNKSFPDDILFVEKWIYDYGLLFEYSVCCYWTDKFNEAKKVSLELLQHPSLPENFREAIERNLTWINLKLNQK